MCGSGYVSVSVSVGVGAGWSWGEGVDRACVKRVSVGATYPIWLSIGSRDERMRAALVGSTAAGL